MPLPLYLDAARMGMMTPGTQSALQDFVRFAGENGGSLYFDRFFRDGFETWPNALQERYPGFRSWRGLGPFKKSLRQFVGLPKHAAVFLAGRTTQLMRLGAACLFRQAKRVLFTDLAWPSYAKILEETRRRQGGRSVCLRLRNKILSGGIPRGDVIERIVRSYLDNQCEGLFLPEVSHHGVRLPVREICSVLRRIQPSSFLFIDGAQALGHVPVNLGDESCDLFLAGSQKWLGAYLPLGMAFCPRPESQPGIRAMSDGFHRTTAWDDPLAAFLHQIEANCEQRFAETVNLSPLFSCQAAVYDGIAEPEQARSAYAQRVKNAGFLSQALPYLGWIALRPSEDLSSGILVVQTPHTSLRRQDADQIRAAFLARGISVSCYPDGVIRLSMPQVSFTGAEIRTISHAFLNCDRELGMARLAPLSVRK